MAKSKKTFKGHVSYKKIIVLRWHNALLKPYVLSSPRYHRFDWETCHALLMCLINLDTWRINKTPDGLIAIFFLKNLFRSKVLIRVWSSRKIVINENLCLSIIWMLIRIPLYSKNISNNYGVCLLFFVNQFR